MVCKNLVASLSSKRDSFGPNEKVEIAIILQPWSRHLMIWIYNHVIHDFGDKILICASVIIR